MTPNTVRAFIAIPLPADLREQLGRVQRKLERAVPPGSVRWVRPDGIHLTLKFLGDTVTARLPEIEAALAAVARNVTPCPFAVGGLGCFPNLHSPRVVWVGVQEPAGKMALLQDAIEEVMEPFGYPREGRGFHPHLTLGRVQQGASRQEKAQIGEVVGAAELGVLGEVAADWFELIQSVLKPSGAEYTTLKVFSL
ncbi:MAG: RNA 2',3'-cyclic phosphodiesterase [Anaerolineae bacterium]|nr:RNA 2',3'-cyclic phosphodiesterase [Anaerolineae bacterium]